MSANLFGLIGGLVGLALFVIVMVWFWSAVAKAGKAKNAAERLAVRGSNATVLEVGPSHEFGQGRGTGGRSLVLTSLRLEIAPLSGPSYRAITRWAVEPAHLSDIAVGKTVPVKVDPKKPTIVFPDVPWATQPSAREGTEQDMDRGSR